MAATEAKDSEFQTEKLHITAPTDTPIPLSALQDPLTSTTHVQSAGGESLTGVAPETSIPSNNARPALVQLGSSSASHPKRFSSSTINKKFLEKTSTSSSSFSASATATTSKLGPITRPITQANSTPSRLVTAKLTTVPQSSASGAVWPRPTSATPPVTSTTSPLLNGAVPSTSAHHSTLPGHSNLPSTGKPSNPQGRVYAKSGEGLTDTNGRPVWRNLRPSAGNQSALTPYDFPTAAEVAQGARNAKAMDAKQAEIAMASKLARLEEADTFRGVHLDPNAHHWDEMEEDDATFLDSVIEFGDGRQYKIEASEVEASSLPQQPLSDAATLQEQSHIFSATSSAAGPVSKEDRFADDFDRRWPRSHHQSEAGQGEPLPNESSNEVQLHRLSEQSRVLFNERSNKLEPYNSSQKPGPPFQKRFQQPEHTPIAGATSAKTSDPSRRPHALMNGSNFHNRVDVPRRFPPDTSSNPLVKDHGLQRLADGHATTDPSLGRVKEPHDSPAASKGPGYNAWQKPLLPHPPHHEPPASVSDDQTHISSSSVSQSEPQKMAITPDALDDVRRDLMQNAAARAKQRRQLEEEDREREKERARRKAAEIEERMKATEKQTKDSQEDPAQVLIENVLASTQHATHTIVPADGHQLTSPQSPVLHPERRPLTSRRASASGPSTTSTTASWRSKPMTSPADSDIPAQPFGQHPLRALEKTLAETNIDVEVVDFTNLSSLVNTDKAVSAPHPAKTSRPIASDFFDDGSPDKATYGTSETSPTVLHGAPSVFAQSKASRPVTSSKEPTLSALDDAMSRIRGAIDVMQATGKELGTIENSEAKPSLPPIKERWIPPALRPRAFDPSKGETFLVTSEEPPRSPKHTYNVRLPASPKAKPPVLKRQIINSSKPIPLRWDILSFDPPVEGMKRDFSLNDILFRPYKGRFKYRVFLPRVRPTHRPIPLNTRINMPGPGKVAMNPYVKPTAADDALTWRKTRTLESIQDLSPVSMAASLDTMSRSPPPDISAHLPGSSPKTLDPRQLPAKSRSQPKMPEGTSVAFYRDPRGHDRAASKSVSFIVTSELEDIKSQSSGSVSGLSFPSSGIPQAIPTLGSIGSSLEHTLHSDFLLSSPASSSKPDSKSSDDSSGVPITPPHHATTWSRTSLGLSGKETTIRGPDPEHLKAVWSQTSDEREGKPVNSLEGIVDDLTALPFTLQDVKSEDGGTPPPPSTASSRMSLHDVTRAFQQVPPAAVPRPAISPPTTNAPVARPQTYTYALPNDTSNQNLRQAYHGYPSPMLSHSPAPIVYPMAGSRIPTSGATQLYNPTPMWMPMHHPPQAQTHGGMMQPVASYQPVMAYSSVPAQPLYVPSPQPSQPSGTFRRNMTTAPHSNQTFGASPVLMQSRPAMRTDLTNPSMHPHAQAPRPTAYAPMQPSPLMRPW